MRDGRILRFAEAGTDSAVGWSVWCLNTAEADKGLAVFNRSGHFAGPGSLMQWCSGKVKWEEDNEEMPCRMHVAKQVMLYSAPQEGP